MKIKRHKTYPTQEQLKELFTYNDGQLYWKESRYKGKNVRSISEPAGGPDKKNSSNAYMRICIDQKRYLTHRLIFTYHHGYVPDFIDHIDGNRTNNRIENLREATIQQNSYNKKSNSSTGYKNVYLRGNGMYRVSFSLNGKPHIVGLYKNLEDAVVASKNFRENYHGQFANHN
jgi:hypothetical protein